MKKTLLSSLLACAITPSFLCHADRETVIITIPAPTPSNGGHKPHAPARPIASGYFDFETNQLCLSFLRDLGICTIEASSTAGELHLQMFDTSAGGMFCLNLSGAPGLYTISIISENGLETGTHFIL